MPPLFHSIKASIRNAIERLKVFFDSIFSCSKLYYSRDQKQIHSIRYESSCIDPMDYSTVIVLVQLQDLSIVDVFITQGLGVDLAL